MFEIIFLVAVSLYFIQTIIFTIGLNKTFSKLSENQLPQISVIVAARNEEENIFECMTALDGLNYPEDKIEIIIANDHSTDSTEKIIRDFIKDKPRFKTIIPVKGEGNLKGKANAIDKAVKISNGELILTTDADCSPNPEWAKTVALYFTKDVAMVSGYTTQYERNLFEAMQSVDFVYLLSVAGGVMNLNKPLSCIGNNMSYRKSVYEEVGGYNSVKFSVTEDFALLMAMHKLKKYKIIHPVDKDLFVISKPCKNVKSLFHQKKRWGVGGLQSETAGFAVMTSGWLSHLGILLLPFFFSATAFYISLFKIITDFFFISPVYKKLALKLNLKHFLVFEIYFVIYVFLLPFIVLTNKKVIWKGREF
ncbi:MAG: glycosyl transferase [Ignavibacteria bacterium GWB2_35_6b]|nr:MAG: glycosyl transferase [Ignavibacteria bacterium GWB2_35_6b]